MGKRYNLIVHNSMSEEYLKEFKYNSIFRYIHLEKKSIGRLKVTNDGSMFGTECPFEIAEWIHFNIVSPIENGGVTLEKLQAFSKGMTDLGAYNLRLFLREVLFKKGQPVDNWTEEYKKRKLEIKS